MNSDSRGQLNTWNFSLSDPRAMNREIEKILFLVTLIEREERESCVPWHSTYKQDRMLPVEF